MSTFQRAVKKALKSLKKNPFPLVSLGPVDGDIYNCQSIMMGPENSPYQGGVFKFTLWFPPKYPFKPQRFQFKTKVYHPNIDANGYALLPKLMARNEWLFLDTIPQILESIYSLLKEPKVGEDDRVVDEIADLYVSDNVVFLSIAEAWTKEHATL